MHDLLTYCESFKRWHASVDYAARLAALFDCRLTGIYVCPSPSMVLSPYETPQLMTELLEATRQLEEEAFGAAASFEAFARGRSATRASWLVAEEEVPRALALAGNWHDALVIGRTRHTPWGAVSAVGSLVLSSGMPCIVVPESQTDGVSLDAIAIAWNGSSEAIRATHAALPLLRRARKVTILHGRQRQPASMTAWKPAFDLAEYLAGHGIPSESILLPESDNAAGNLLLDSAREANANLLVMGAYGHTRFSEWVLGGATRAVLEGINIPVFMRH